MKKIISSVKGTRDYYPEDMAVRTWLYEQMRMASESFGYQEYEAPMLETIDLYAAKSGEELVNQQSYVFADRGGDMITLRPEMTPSLARLVAQRQKQLVYPLRWWSFGPFWRYEKPQKGRTRELFQWNIDLIGPDTPASDAELVAIAAMFFKNLGLTSKDVVILVNDRMLINQELANLGVPIEKRTDVLSLIDRKAKMSPIEWDAYAMDIGLTMEQLAGLKAVLANTDLWRKSDRLVGVFAVLESMGVKDYVKYDPCIIRGLLYYTSTVFEAYDKKGVVKRSILGGGRYDNLMADVGGEPLPAVGFAMGDTVISLILQQLDRVPKNGVHSPADVLVTAFDPELLPASLGLAASLRKAGLKVIGYTEGGKLPKQFKFADRMGIRLIIVIGPDEAAADLVTIKDLKSGTQQTVQRANVVKIVQDQLTEH